VLTYLEGRAQRLYDELYCARGEMENRIKEQQLRGSRVWASATCAKGPQEIADHYRVSLGMVKKLLQQRKRTGDIGARHAYSGRKPIMSRTMRIKCEPC
jgi:hypothetical protein